MTQKSLFNGSGYAGYRVSLRLVREGYADYAPIVIACPHDVYEFMKELKDFDRERFYAICLDTRHQVVHCEEISSGSAERTVAHPRDVFKSAILSSSTGIILTHNHPSGDPAPSPDDYDVTERLYECGDLLGIEVLDHVIIGRDEYFSFRDSGDIPKLARRHPPESGDL